MGSRQKKEASEAGAAKRPRVAGRTKLRSGDVIDDRFTVIGRPLGKGGMGTVYKVHDDDGGEYAIKRLSPALHEEKRFVTRFQREYDAASTLRHPNIIAYQELFDVDGVLHIRMEYNDGINLRQLIRHEKTLSVEVATSICRDLARALEHLHAHRVVHRDIKPENVLLGRKGSVKLCDFGISRFEYSNVTRTGTLLGTPRYMSPEQLAGRKGDDIGPASDLYALGIVLYEMLTGKDPYRLRKKADILEVINVKQSKEPKALPQDFDPDLSDLVMQLLEHDPDMRPESARKVGQLLGRWALSRREQKSVFRGVLDDLEGGGSSSRRLPGPKRKRNSFWENPPPTDAPDTEMELPPEPSYPLFPAFVVTLLFLVLLWGLGLLQQHRNSTPGDRRLQGSMIPAAPASPDRTLLLQRRSSVAKRRKRRRSRRTRRRRRSRRYRRRKRTRRSRRKRRRKKFRRRIKRKRSYRRKKRRRKRRRKQKRWSR